MLSKKLKKLTKDKKIYKLKNLNIKSLKNLNKNFNLSMIFGQ